MAVVIGTITESEPIIEQAAENKGGLINMCGALERLEERGVKRGIRQRNEEIVLQMLKKGMENRLIHEITGTDEEAIEQLRKDMKLSQSLL